jgi:hypothetical protein
MDDQKPVNTGNDQGLNKIDLTQLQDFTFGTQWTEVKRSAPAHGRERERDFDHGGGPGRGGFDRGEPKRDRRSFRRPVGAPAPVGGAEGGAPAPRDGRGGGGPGRGGFDRGDRPRGEGFRGGSRRDFRGGDRRERGEPVERGPYISPHFNITCYPEDAGFAAMVKAVRASCRTFQLFEITRAVLEKNERFVIVIQRKPAEKPAAQPVAPAAEGAAAEPVPAEPARPSKPAPLYMAQPDHLPFDTEEAAVQHVLKNHLGLFFDTTEVEVEPPKGNFPIINKCGITGELLGPPNYHRYQQILQQHHATRLGRMPFEKFRDSIVTVREPEVVQQWLDRMKKVTRYTWKAAAPAPKPASGAPFPTEAATPVAEGGGSVPASHPSDAPEAAVASEPAPATPPVAPAGPSFDTLDEARAYLLTHAKDRVVRAVETVRFHGKLIEKLPPGEIKRAIEGHVERQRRFPLDTANALRGRLRREGFTIFKKGSRGISYVCAVKRRFRVPGQVFSDSISALIDFVEKNPMVHVKELPQKFLGVDLAAAMAATPLPEGTPQSQAPFMVLPPEQGEKLRKMNNDLRWLVTEGYVTEFSDGKLYAPPPMTPQTARKAEEHGEEHDPVDFPEAPVSAEAAAPKPAGQSATVPNEPAPAPEAPAAEGEAGAPAGGSPFAPESEPVSEAAPINETPAPSPESAPAAAAPAAEPKPEAHA